MSDSKTTGIRPARAGDAGAIAAIYNQGIEERLATFETRQKGKAEIEELIAEDLVIVAERDSEVAGFAKVAPYEARSPYYAGIGEVTLYVERDARRLGLGRELLEGICAAAAERGQHKLVAKIFAGNEPSLELFDACGFRRVGVHQRHAALEGDWKDVVVVERALIAA